MVASSKIMIKQSLLSTAAVISLIAVSAAGSQPAKSIWYNKPANDWKSEALSIGNSCMGAMLFGGVKLGVGGVSRAFRDAGQGAVAALLGD